MEPVEVIAVFNEQGEVSPLSFKRGGQQYQVDKVGKQWEDDTGSISSYTSQWKKCWSWYSQVPHFAGILIKLELLAHTGEFQGKLCAESGKI